MSSSPVLLSEFDASGIKRESLTEVNCSESDPHSTTSLQQRSISGGAHQQQRQKPTDNNTLCATNTLSLGETHTEMMNPSYTHTAAPHTGAPSSPNTTQSLSSSPSTSPFITNPSTSPTLAQTACPATGEQSMSEGTTSTVTGTHENTHPSEEQLGTQQEQGAVIFHDLRNLRKSPRGFLREEMSFSVRVGYHLAGVKVMRDPEHHEFVNVFEFNILRPEEVFVCKTGSSYTRYSANLNAALTRRPSKDKKKRSRVQTPISQNETVFRLNNAARGVGTAYRLHVAVKEHSPNATSCDIKSEIFRVFGPTSDFGRTTNQDKMNTLTVEQRQETIRKISRDTIEEMMPEIVTTVRLHLFQHHESQRQQQNQHLEMLMQENKRLQEIISGQYTS